MLTTTGIGFEIKPLEKGSESIFLDVTSRFKDYWVSAGTALGLYRDGDFIEGDTDYDIAMIGHDGIREEIKEKMKDLILIREVNDDDRIMQLAFHKNGTIVDIYIHWENGDNIENHAESGWTRMKRDICSNPQWIETKYGKLPIPQEEYFNIRYGDDWKIPQNKKPIFYEV